MKNVDIKENEAYDLLGNTVAVPVVEHVANKVAVIYQNSTAHLTSKEIPAYS